MGIPPAAVDRLFTRFYRTEAARERGIAGSGLGLAIVK
jgi:signal transduction histidine kinase